MDERNEYEGKFVIIGIFKGEYGNEEIVLFWSNEIGWVDSANATLFDERPENLPMEAHLIARII